MDYEKFKLNFVLNLTEVDITPEEVVGGSKNVTAPERLASTLFWIFC